MASVLRRLYNRLTLSKDVSADEGSRVLTRDEEYDHGNCRDGGVVTSQLQSLLGPIEHHVVTIQCILIWEKPLVSCLALLLFNLLFWVIVSFEFRFYFVLALGSAVTYFYRTWVNQIWPEIRVPTPEGEDTEEWTPVNLQVLSVPEISRYLDQMIRTAQQWWTWLFDLRLSKPGTFCALVTGILVVVALIGHYVTGVLIAYAILMTVMLGPGFVVHVYPHLKEFFTSDAFVGMCSPQMMDVYDDEDEEPKPEPEVNADMDYEEEFLPEATTETLDILNKAALDSYDTDGDTSSSMAASRELGVDAILPTESNDSLAFRADMDDIPSYDHDSDNDEFSDNLKFPSFAPNSIATGTLPANIQFVPSHFNDGNAFSSDEDEMDNAEDFRNDSASRLLAATSGTTTVAPPPPPPNVITPPDEHESSSSSYSDDDEVHLTPKRAVGGDVDDDTFLDEFLDTTPSAPLFSPPVEQRMIQHIDLTASSDEDDNCVTDAQPPKVPEVMTAAAQAPPRSYERLPSHQSDADLSDYEIVSESELLS